MIQKTNHIHTTIVEALIQNKFMIFLNKFVKSLEIMQEKRQLKITITTELFF